MNLMILVAFLVAASSQPPDEPKPVATMDIRQLFDAVSQPEGLKESLGKHYKLTGVKSRRDHDMVATFILSSSASTSVTPKKSVLGIWFTISSEDGGLACLSSDAAVTVYATVAKGVGMDGYYLQISKAECGEQEGALLVKSIGLSVIAGAAAVGLNQAIAAEKQPDGTLTTPPVISPSSP